MKNVYISSTLHNEWNLKFNPELCKVLENKGISCYLPQRDTNQKESAKSKFNQNMKGMKKSKIILAVAMNETANWGAEVGFAHSQKKKIIALTDKKHKVPIMADGMMTRIVRVNDLENIKDYIDKLEKALK